MLILYIMFCAISNDSKGGHGVGGEDSDHSDHAGEEDDHSEHGRRFLQEEGHEGHDDSSESQNAAKFGCAILGGFLLPLVFAILFHHDKPNDTKSPSSAMMGDEESCESCNPLNVETGVSTTSLPAMTDDEKKPPQDKHAENCDICAEGDEGENKGEHTPSRVVSSGQNQAPQLGHQEVDRSLCASILLGDAFHNFADGVFIAAAFKSCSAGTAISIVLVTLFHEIAQELADFVLLTRYAGLSILKACVLNFLSGLSVCLGGVIFLATNPTPMTTGILLAMAGGVYFNIAACETIPRLEKIIKNRRDRVVTLLAVIVGTIPIGLILLDHRHCG